MSVDILLKYFPLLTVKQRYLYRTFYEIFVDINFKINLISRKDIDNLYEHHILHSLSIAKFVTFNAEDKVIDIGTGGGFPGIPLAILFSNTRFTLLDSCNKKINAVEKIVTLLKLNNVNTVCCRSEEYNHDVKYNYVLGRAVTNIDKFIRLNKHLVCKSGKILYLNGNNETSLFKHISYKLHNIFVENYFATKQLMIFNF